MGQYAIQVKLAEFRHPSSEHPTHGGIVSRVYLHSLKPVTATKAKVMFGEILHETSVNTQRFVVNRQGRPVAVILSYNEYLALLEKSKEDR